MAYYRSGFIAADERAKAIQKYIDMTNDRALSDKERYLFVMNGNAAIHDVLMGSEADRKTKEDYYSRLRHLFLELAIKEQEQSMKLGYPYKFSLRTKTSLILKLQQEYITMAGIFGRTGVKAVQKRGGEEEKIKSIIEKEEPEDDAEDTLDI